MPPPDIEVTVAQVTSLLSDQWAGWHGQDVTRFASGWDNVLFRVGDEHLARLPRRQMAVPLVEQEARWLPTLGPHLPLPVPVPLMLGKPGNSYPWPWTLVRWIRGTSAALSTDIDHGLCASQLGSFLRALHRPAPSEAPINPYRGVPLRERGQVTRERIRDFVEDVEWALGIWGRAIAAEESRDRVWLHGDLHPHNLLIEEDAISGVVDFGDLCGGDPATDLAVRWSFLPGETHPAFVAAYGVDDPALWARARGWALTLGLAYVANSADNPVMSEIGVTMLDRLAATENP